MNTVHEKPPWLMVKATPGPNYQRLKGIMRAKTLHTVCEEAHCPNIFECWDRDKTATFMILGDTCTRNCRFCAVKSGRPGKHVDWDEPDRVADAVRDMQLAHVVITSVDRDDLQDGGASIFAATVMAIRRQAPGCQVELLIPDFAGDEKALQIVVDQQPELLDHNVETVRRMTPKVRSRATYDRSLTVLRNAKMMLPGQRTKSSIMLGVGETWDEILETLDDLRASGVDIVTIGQYLRPTPQQMQVVRFYTPDEFAALQQEGMSRGFLHVESGPLVRTSYHAARQALRAAIKP
ncbi:lipoyl synthase [Sulfobacillus harzensis]|uniref:Lipoyl synthase n=1 Tax=Sulfobacillus harzensis TaxID=2729629 RepID=A0A7Y0Q5E1_9FIRM|nr:lipoyl synthase [Sulfobacillus harzensis]NMP24991.1 lipoyl synthase [Sulfobacillus harzensis]